MNPSDEQPQLPTVQSQVSSDDNSQLVQPVVQPQTTQPMNDISTPQSAGDEDLIEKEWVDKAKEIIDNTIGNPHAQSDQLAKVKADYIRKRYGKDIQT